METESTKRVCRKPLVYITRRLLRKTAIEERLTHMMHRIKTSGSRKRRVVKAGARSIYGLHVVAA